MLRRQGAAALPVSAMHRRGLRGVLRLRWLPIDPADVKTIVGQVDAGLYDAMVMEADRAYCNRLSPEILEISRMAGVGYEADDLHKALGARIYQFCDFVEPACEHLVTDVTTSVMTTRWNDLFCDVVPKASSKPRGIQATLEHHGLRGLRVRRRRP